MPGANEKIRSRRRTFRDVEVDFRSGDYPLGLKFSVPTWIVYSGMLIVVGASLGAGGSGGDDQGTADALRGQLGTDNVAYPDQPTGWIAAMVILGVLCLAGAVFLALGRWWARPLVVAVGAIGVISLAAAARWETVLAIVILIVAAAPLVSSRVHRYLRARDA